MEPKKKTWIVRLHVNMCAEHEVTVLTKATKEHLAIDKAIKECYRNGYFHAQSVSCKEVKRDKCSRN